MMIKLNKPFASNGGADELDVRQMKKALNKLGYYTPLKETGITDTPDRAVFDALKQFQTDQNLTPTGTARPGDATITALNDAQNEQKKTTVEYTWRTAGDNKVRKAHAALEGERRVIGENTLDPGEDPNCRCWMADVKIKQNCEEEEIAYQKAVRTSQAAKQKYDSIASELEILIAENNDLNNSIGNIWGITGASGMLPKIVGQVAGNVVQGEAKKAQGTLSNRLKKVRLQIEYLKGELTLARSALTKVQNNEKQALMILEECRKKHGGK